jgi:hypothetical protein
MNLLKSFEFVPGVKWFEGEMHNSLFQHSVFGAIVFLVVSNTEVYKFVKDTIFSVSGVKLDGNTLQLVHAVVFAVIMYFGSLFILVPLLTEGLPKKKKKGKKGKKKKKKEGQESEGGLLGATAGGTQTCAGKSGEWQTARDDEFVKSGCDATDIPCSPPGPGYKDPCDMCRSACYRVARTKGANAIAASNECARACRNAGNGLLRPTEVETDTFYPQN